MNVFFDDGSLQALVVESSGGSYVEDVQNLRLGLSDVQSVFAESADLDGDGRYELIVAYGLAGVVVGWLAIMKWTQPLHFDVGDKARYQI